MRYSDSKGIFIYQRTLILVIHPRMNRSDIAVNPPCFSHGSKQQRAMTDSLSGSILSQQSVVSVAVTRQKEVAPIDWNVYSPNHSHPSRRLQHSRRNREEALRLPLSIRTTNEGTYVSVRSVESNKQFSASVSPRGRRK